RSAVGARDVVLLTHPRSLAEEDVVTAARRAAAPVRLFAMTLDGHGAAALSELRHGAPVRLRDFRVDFTRSEPPAAPPPAPPEPSSPWRRHVEEVGFPFRFGIPGWVGSGQFDFDHAGDWLLTVTEHGLLFAWKTDGSAAEILPRGLLYGAVLTEVDAVVGVAGGFVVLGRARN